MQRVQEPEYMDLTEEAEAYGQADFSEVNKAFVNRLFSLPLDAESPAAAKTLVQHHAGNESALLQEEFYRSLLAAYTVEEVKEQLATAGLSGLTVAQVTNRHLDVFGNVTA